MTTNNSSNIPTGAANTVLQGQGVGSNAAFSTATYPATTTANQLLYSSATNTVGGLATANSATLVTNASGVPAMTASLTNGQIVIGSTGATPTPAALTAGAGITITNGAGSITVANRGCVFLGSASASASTSLDFTTNISATYETYMFQIEDLVPTTNAVQLHFLVSTDGGTTWLGGTNYLFSVGGTAANLTSWDVTNSGVGGAAQATLSPAVIGNTYGGISLNFWLYNPSSAINRKQYFWNGVLDNGGPNTYLALGGGDVNTTGTAINAVRFIMSSGTIATGTIKFFGFVNS